MTVDVCGVILAGGLARRMGGGDKGLLDIAGHPILSLIIDRLRPQVSHLVLNANGDPARFDEFNLPVVADTIADYPGPLAGVLAGMDWAAANTDCNWIVTIATDTPFFPQTLVRDFQSAVQTENARLAVAASAGRHHPVIGLWPVALRDDLADAMLKDEIRKVDRWTARYPLCVVEYPVEPYDPFFNTNRAEDMNEAEQIYAQAVS